MLISSGGFSGPRTKPDSGQGVGFSGSGFLRTLFALVIFIVIFIAYSCSTSQLRKELGYSDDAIVLIVNADDVGLHADETDATLQAMKLGMVTSGSLMVPCPDYERAMRAWKKNPALDFGIHLTLTCEWGLRYPWAPVLPKETVSSLFAQDGLMWPDVESLTKHARLNEVLMEAEAQIRKVLELGAQPTHLDAHMDWYLARTDYFEGVMRLARKYRLPMRVWKSKRTRMPWWPNNPAQLHRQGFVFPDTQTSYYNIDAEGKGVSLREESYIRFLESLRPGVHEVTIHLAFRTGEMEAFMGPKDIAWREADYNIWTGQSVRAIIETRKIILIGFRDLQRIQEIKWLLEEPYSLFPYRSLPWAYHFAVGNTWAKDFSHRWTGLFLETEH